MFGFANGLLLLLLAAAVIDFAPVVRRRLFPASWWNDERLLFTPRGGDCAKNTVHGRFCLA